MIGFDKYGFRLVGEPMPQQEIVESNLDMEDKNVVGAVGTVGYALKKSIVDEATGIIVAIAKDEEQANRLEQKLNNRNFQMV